MDWTALLGSLYLVAFALAIGGAVWMKINEDKPGWDDSPTETFCQSAVAMIFVSGIALATLVLLGF